MSKLITDDLANLENEATAVSTINDNFAAVETAMENTLSLDGTTPNAMGANLDMDSNRILNLPAPSAATEPARHGDITTYVTDATTQATAAAASATAAASSESAAAASATAAAASATAAASAASETRNPALAFNYDNVAIPTGIQSGQIRLDDLDLSLATAVYLNDTTAEGTNLEAEMLTWGDSTATVKGKLILTAVDGGEQAVFNITAAASDQSGYVQLTVAYVDGVTSFTDNEGLTVFSIRTGDDGAGAGDVVGPGSATDNAIIRWDGTNGVDCQNSGVTIDDSNNISGINNTTGSDTNLCTGTAGSNGNVAMWNADGDLVDGSVAASGVYASGGTDVAVADGGTGSSTASGARTNLAAAAASQTEEALAAFVLTPATGTYLIGLNMPHAGTITQITTKSASGTGNMDVEIEGTDVTVSSDAISSTQNAQTPSGNNTFSAGDDIQLNFTTVSSLSKVSIMIKYTRTLV